MAHDVFICHASDDRDIAGRVVVALEQHGVGCWIAPRDVTPGADYARAIVTAIGGSRMLLLVLSRAANTSPHVRREVERAVSRDVPILPFRIEEVLPSESLEYYISDSQWFDVYDGDLEDHLRRLVEVVGGERPALEATGAEPTPDEPRSPEDDDMPDLLRSLVGRYGAELVDEPRRVRALLRDVAGHRKLDISALVTATEEGVGAALRSSPGPLGRSVKQRLTRRLAEERGLRSELAAWAVDTWEYALGPQPPPESGKDAGVTAPAPAVATPSPPEPNPPPPTETMPASAAGPVPDMGDHAVMEEKLLGEIAAGTAPFPAADRDEAERLLGGRGASVGQRLDLDGGGPDDLRRRLLETTARWKRRAENPLASRDEVEAARVVVRSCEGMLAALDPA